MVVAPQLAPASQDPWTSILEMQKVAQVKKNFFYLFLYNFFPSDSEIKRHRSNEKKIWR